MNINVNVDISGSYRIVLHCTAMQELALFLFYDYSYPCGILWLTKIRPLKTMRTQNKKGTVQQKWSIR